MGLLRCHIHHSRPAYTYVREHVKVLVPHDVLVQVVPVVVLHLLVVEDALHYLVGRLATRLEGVRVLGAAELRGVPRGRGHRRNEKANSIV